MSKYFALAQHICEIVETDAECGLPASEKTALVFEIESALSKHLAEVAPSDAVELVRRWWEIYGGSTCDDGKVDNEMEALDKDTEEFLKRHPMNSSRSEE